MGMHPLLICLFKERRHLEKKIKTNKQTTENPGCLSFKANILGSRFVGKYTASIKPEIGEGK